jgi:ArsR family transcriptional regulator, arsenate/arsenite/antimonite-responsive transcriptional repressor
MLVTQFDFHRTVMKSDELARIFRALSHPVRMRLLSLLMESPDGQEPGRLAKTVGKTKSTLSSHLAIMRKNRLIYGERDGRNIRYRIDRVNVELISNRLAILLGRESSATSARRPKTRASR